MAFFIFVAYNSATNSSFLLGYRNCIINQEKEVVSIKIKYFLTKSWTNKHNLCYTELDTHKNDAFERRPVSMFTAINIAGYIISEFVEKEKTITNLKLQKMLYYVQGYSLKELNRAAFREAIYHWPYGPVVPECYYTFCGYGAHPIDDKALERIEAIEIPNTKLKRLVDKIINVCTDKTARQLVSMTHGEAPWQNTDSSQEICKECIETYFRDHDPLSLIP